MNVFGILFVLILATQTSFSSQGISLGAGLTNVVVDIHNHCKKLHNASSNSYFVPTNTDQEWTLFLDHLPTGVTSSDCITYTWQVGAWSACTGGAGSWNYDTWGECLGGTADYSYGLWGTCSLSCGGGIQTRTSSCVVNANSGLQSRNYSCSFTANSGSQSALVQCASANQLGVFLGYVADSFCELTVPKPPTSQLCTPSDTSLCGTLNNTQTCTPSSLACTGSPITSTTCNPQACCTWQWSCGGTGWILANPNGAELEPTCRLQYTFPSDLENCTLGGGVFDGNGCAFDGPASWVCE